MTAEVAVMNKSAVALAADSAMSVTVGQTRKTYPTNKLFALTKHHPVGIMIYNNAEFMNVPWETIVKMYREELGSSIKPTVQDYAEDFLGYVANESICTPVQKAHNLRRVAADLFGKVTQSVPRSPEASGHASDISASVAEVIADHLNALRSTSEAASMENIDAGMLIREDESAINALIDRCFRPLALEISDSIQQSLHELLAVFVKSKQLSHGYSGLVFAGFGEEEIFPSLVEVVTDGAIGHTVKAYNTKNTVDLDRTGIHTSINAFAQSEMVGRFMNGVDIEFVNYLTDYLRVLFTNMTKDLIEADLTDATLVDSQLAAIQAVVQTKLDDFQRSTADFCRTRFVSPVLEIVRHLPKEELASMAEALVNLTSLKRRVSKEEETVGGPIDVAVISKGDGFIWIKRKHYFDPSLNRDYFERRSPRHTPQEATSEVQAVQA